LFFILTPFIPLSSHQYLWFLADDSGLRWDKGVR
jgi:hypothetical protein